MKITRCVFTSMLSTFCFYQSASAELNSTPGMDVNNKSFFSKWITESHDVVDLSTCNFDNQIDEDLYECSIKVIRSSIFPWKKTVCEVSLLFSRFDNKYKLPEQSCASDLIGSVGRYMIAANTLIISGYYFVTDSNSHWWHRSGPRDSQFTKFYEKN